MKKKILIIVDAQKDFCSVGGSLSSDDCVSTVDRIVEKLKTENYEKVVCTFDTHNSQYGSTLEGKLLPVKHCKYGEDGWDLDSRIKDALSGIPYEKVKKYTFGFTNWYQFFMSVLDMPIYGESDDEFSKDYEIEIVGFCTDICVVSNAIILRANFPNIDITVDANCCCGTSAEAHNAACKTMQSCQINVIL